MQKITHPLRAWRWVALLAIFVFGVATSVSAQNTGNANDDISKLSTQEMQSRSADMIKNMERIRLWIVSERDKAKKENDVAAYDCLGEHLTVVKTLLGIAEGAQRELNEAAQSKSSSEEEKRNNASREYTRIAQADAQAREREIQAKLCSGKAGSYTGNTQVFVEKPKDDNNLDPTLPPWTPQIYQRRVDASTFY
ncbi:MAG: hypothetical protein H6727_08855 [Myxococcales bacterium]|nr:hypothetical protein [Myxococcales bacterium]